MRHITSKIVSFICAMCMVMACGIGVYAAEAVPEIAIAPDKTNKKAEIRINNVGTMIYSAQITLNVNNESATYTLTAKNSNAYSTLKQDGKSVILYVDSTDLMDGNKTINLASLTSDNTLNIGSKAELVIVDRSMNSKTYSDINVKIVKDSDNSQNSSGSGSGGGGTSGGTGSSIIAGGTSNPGNTATTPSNTAQKKFEDVSGDYWAGESIAYVTGRGLFEGTSDTKFEPNIPMTRSMYVSVLKRFGAKIDKTWDIPCDNPMKFNDIPEGEWYSEAVAWAGGIGLVNGIGENMFGPYISITREQIAVMTVNFAKLCGKTLPEKEAAVNFADEGKVNDWAKDAVKTAQKAGLIYGREDGNFAPQDTATRAEVAAILHRFVQSTAN